MANLDYPPAKLDIKIVLEEVDTSTIEAATKLAFPGNVDLIVVPDRQPRTKPKALNYALQFATGDLAVIYDAEDRPEPDQLRKAATRFQFASPDVACLQARLDYFNPHENWLSRQFTIEYATLFRGLLPLLSRFGLPLPLGGTSNHFRIGVLRDLGAWDPFNVTEDADLGMRLHRAGYLVETLDSTTYEEACCQSVPWIKQRTRWLKGWMQTFGVHMRAPVSTLRETGLTGFLAFHAYFAGIIVSSLAHPLCYFVLAYDAWNGTLFRAGYNVWRRHPASDCRREFLGRLHDKSPARRHEPAGDQAQGALAARRLHPVLLALRVGGGLPGCLAAILRAVLLGKDHAWRECHVEARKRLSGGVGAVSPTHRSRPRAFEKIATADGRDIPRRQLPVRAMIQASAPRPVPMGEGTQEALLRIVQASLLPGGAGQDEGRDASSLRHLAFGSCLWSSPAMTVGRGAGAAAGELKCPRGSIEPIEAGVNASFASRKRPSRLIRL